MLIVHDLSQLPESIETSVVTMGDFDGVHTGHLKLIENTVASARARKSLSVLVTYEPSPKKILKRLDYDQRLTTYAEKSALLSETGLDIVVFYPMTRATLAMSAKTFLRDFLLKRLKMKKLIMGADHRFGHNRRGNSSYLSKAAHPYGFEMVVVDEQLTGEKRTSSSRVRAAIMEGDVAEAGTILGRPYSAKGTIVRGQSMGKKLGFATANLALDREKLLPATGVYAGHAIVTGSTAGRYPAVANLGNKPTLGKYALGLEVHLLDFDGDLYGAELEFCFEHRLRGEQKFNGLEELKAQIALDADLARKKLS